MGQFEMENFSKIVIFDFEVQKHFKRVFYFQKPHLLFFFRHQNFIILTNLIKQYLVD
jgi:hypothetical protein